MNWLKVGAIVVGGIIVFVVLDSVVHILLGLLTTIAFVAIVAGGGYAAYKILGARRRREVRDGSQQRRPPRQVRSHAVAVPPEAPEPAPRPRPAQHDVEDDLARLKREMGG